MPMPSLGLFPLSTLFAIAPLAWTQLFAGVGVGIVIAVALQFCLLLLGSAIALTLLPLPSLHSKQETATQPVSRFSQGWLVGLGGLSTVNVVLSVSSFLAMTLVPLPQPSSGAIAGLVIWAIYFLLAIGLIGKTLTTWGKTAFTWSTAGLRGIVSLVTNAFQPNPDDSPLSLAAVKGVVREEVQAALNTWQPLSCAPPTASPPSPVNFPVLAIAQSLQQHLSQASAKSLSPKPLERTLQQYFASVSPTQLQWGGKPLDLEALAAILAAREDLSEKKQTRILCQVQTIWEHYVPTQATATTEAPASHAATQSHPAESRTSPFPQAKDLQAAWTTLNDDILPQLPDVLVQNWATIAPLTAAVTQIDLQDAIDPVQAALHQAEQLRNRASSQLAELQTTLQQETQDRLETLRQDTLTRLAATRKTVAIALWWVFATALTSSISATLAGAIASGFNPLL